MTHGHGASCIVGLFVPVERMHAGEQATNVCAVVQAQDKEDPYRIASNNKLAGSVKRCPDNGGVNRAQIAAPSWSAMLLNPRMHLR